MFSKLYLAPRRYPRTLACVQIARPVMLHARLAYRQMRKAGVTEFDARQWVWLLTHTGQMTQKYIDAAVNIPKEAVGAF